MTRDQVLGVADPILRPVLGDENIQEITVREDEDWSGEPSLYIEVFIVPEPFSFDYDAWGDARLKLSDTLVRAGELRFPYIRLRDRHEESEESEEPPEDEAA